MSLDGPVGKKQNDVLVRRGRLELGVSLQKSSNERGEPRSAAICRNRQGVPSLYETVARIKYLQDGITTKPMRARTAQEIR